MEVKDLRLKEQNRVHFIGIGGISMSGLAQILMTWGIPVSGSDRSDSPTMAGLREKGAKVFVGQAAGQHKGASLVVYTAAIAADNPELVAAHEDGVRCIRRDELLGEIIRQYKTSVGIAGMHGKSTCTSMLATVMMVCQKDPTIHIGAVLPTIGGSVRVGGDDYFITEADEYKESFFKFPPTVAVLLNIDEDHLDYYRDLNHIIGAFNHFVSLVPADGQCIANGDDPLTLQVMQGAPCAGQTFGLNDGCDWRAVDIQAGADGFHSFTLVHTGNVICPVRLMVPGRHNVYNALAAIAAAHACGVKPADAAQALLQYTGADRRFQKAGEARGVQVFHDYAHHPAEVRATLEAAALLPHRKLYCVFQPHTYTRTRTLFQQFVAAFDAADELVLTDIYAAREADPGDIHSKMLCDAINARSGREFCRWAPDFDSVARLLAAECLPGDIVLALGAGSIDQVAPMILSAISSKIEKTPSL